MQANQPQDAHLQGYSAGISNYKKQQEEFNPYDKGDPDYVKFMQGFEDGRADSHTHWTESVVFEGKVKELATDLKDKKMTDADFMKKYGKSRAEAREAMKKPVVESLTAGVVYKHWDQLTPTQKVQSASLGKPKTMWNPQTRKYSVMYPAPADATPQIAVLEDEGSMTAEQLNVGDPVVVTGDVNFKGATGDIDSFGRDKAFVVVNLYNHGRHSFHSSDVSLNEYADSPEEEWDTRNMSEAPSNKSYYDTYDEWVSAVRGEGADIFPSSERGSYVAKAWGNKTIGEFDVTLGDGWIYDSIAEDVQVMNKSEIFEARLRAKLK